MLILSQAQLDECLERYQGELIGAEKMPAYQKFSIDFFDNPTNVHDPRVQFTSQLDITEIYENYLTNYKNTLGATFTAFVKWNAIRAMQNTPFNWRKMNDQWYEFKNLPLEVSVRTQDERQQALFFLDDVSQSSWEVFCSKHSSVNKGGLEDGLELIKRIPLYAIAHEVVGLHIPRMTSYSTTRKTLYAHQPWIVFSDRYKEGNRLLLPLYLSFSHATLTPALAEDFIKRFTSLAKLTPAGVEHKQEQKQDDSALFSAKPITHLHTHKKSVRRSEVQELQEEAKRFTRRK